VGLIIFFFCFFTVFCVGFFAALVGGSVRVAVGMGVWVGAEVYVGSDVAVGGGI